ncbi:MAG TPA: hypothetical protein VM658_12400 [bacterium]|nr:hypothetical protein [bacterium]
MEKEFEHPEPGREVQAISGRYTIIREGILPFDGREVLYLVGAAAFDSSCCGEGGCAYAIVPGFIVAKHLRSTSEGNPVSLVEPVTDESLQKTIASAVQQKENVAQVNFL